MIFLVLLYINLAILLEVDKNLEIYFYYAVLALDFTICLRRKSYKKLAHNFKKIIK